MSRVAKRPVELPQGVTATVASNVVKVKGAKGELSLVVANGVSVEQQDKKLQVKFDGAQSRMTAGATRAHLANMVLGVSKGYEHKLELVGVGFRAAVQGKVLNLTLGFSQTCQISQVVPSPVRAPSMIAGRRLARGRRRSRGGRRLGERGRGTRLAEQQRQVDERHQAGRHGQDVVGQRVDRERQQQRAHEARARPARSAPSDLAAPEHDRAAVDHEADDAALDQKAQILVVRQLVVVAAEQRRRRGRGRTAGSSGTARDSAAQIVFAAGQAEGLLERARRVALDQR